MQKDREKASGARLALQKVFWRLFPYLFGNDVFISYSRRDGADYALSLANELVRRKIVCQLDQWGTPPGKDLPDELIAALKSSTMLVVVGTRGAAESDNVRKEVEAFLETRRRIIPISFEGSLERAEWYPKHLEGLSIRKESPAALAEAKPSDFVITRIVNAEGFVSQRKRLRRTAAGTVLFLIAVILLGYFFVRQAQRGVSIARYEQARAMFQRARAERQAREAEAEAAKALEARDSALEEAKTARGDAVRQQAIAGAYLLVNEAEDLRTRNLDTIEGSVRRAAEALGQFHSLGQVSVEADRTLRRGLELLRPCIAEIPRQNTNSVTAVALSPDGRFVALADVQGTIEVWRISPAAGRSRCPGRAERIWSIPYRVHKPPALAFTRSGQALAIADAGTLRVCSGYGNATANCEEAATFPPEYTLTAFDAQGQVFAMIDHLEKTARVWDLEKGSSFPSISLAGVTGERGDVLRLAVSPVGPQLALGVQSRAEGCDIYVIGIPDGGVRHHFPAAASLSSLALSQDGRWVAAAAGRPEHEIVIWDLKGSQQIRLPLGFRLLSTLSFSPDAGTLAGGGGTRGSGAGLIWDLFSRKEIARLVQPSAIVHAAYSADGRSLAIASNLPPRVRVWDVDHSPADAPLFAVRGPGVTERSALDRSGRYFAASRRGELGMWDIAGRRRLVAETFQIPFLPSFFFGRNSRYFLLLNRGDVQAWELPAGTRVSSLPCNPTGFSQDGHVMVCKAADALEVWRKGETQPLLGVPGNSWANVTLSPGATYLAAETLAGAVHVWHVPDRPEKQAQGLFVEEARSREDARVAELTWSPDDLVLAIRRGSGRLAVWSSQGRRVLRCPADPSAVWAVDFSPNGALLVAARGRLDREKGELRICGLREPYSEWALDLTALPDRRRPLAPHPDGRHVAVGLIDGSVEVWDLVSRKRVAHLGLSVGPPGEIAFSADSDHLVSMTPEGAARTWLWRPEDLIQEAWRRLGEDPPHSRAVH